MARAPLPAQRVSRPTSDLCQSRSACSDATRVHVLRGGLRGVALRGRQLALWFAPAESRPSSSDSTCAWMQCHKYAKQHMWLP